MDPDVERILHHEPDGHGDLPARVAALAASGLWELMSGYDWDEGFAVPLAVVRHPGCDRALALRMFWELDDAAKIHLSDEQNALRETYTVEAAHDPAGFADLVAYCTTLVDGIRNGSFPIGRNSFDTGFFDVDGLDLTDRKRALRAARTRIARREYDEAFLRPVVGATDP